MILGPNDKKKMTEMQLQPQRNPSGTEIADSFISLFIDKKILIAIKKIPNIHNPSRVL